MNEPFRLEILASQPQGSDDSALGGQNGAFGVEEKLSHCLLAMLSSAKSAMEQLDDNGT